MFWLCMCNHRTDFKKPQTQRALQTLRLVHFRSSFAATRRARRSDENTGSWRDALSRRRTAGLSKERVKVSFEKCDQTLSSGQGPPLLCVLQYQSSMVLDHQRTSALIRWWLGVCGAQRLNFHLPLTPASLRRWLTIIAPRDNGRRRAGWICVWGWVRETWASEWKWAAGFFCSAVSSSLLCLAPSRHLKFSPCISSQRDSLCDMICKHHLRLPQEHLTGLSLQTLLLRYNVLLCQEYTQYITLIFLSVWGGGEKWTDV